MGYLLGNCWRGGASPVSLPDWVTAQNLWTWFEIENTALSDLVPSPQPFGSTGPSARISAWNGATLKRTGSVYLLGACGGHDDYGGNEVLALALNTATPAWQTLRTASTDADIIETSEVYLDFRRAATHTYYATQFIQPANKLVILPSPGMGTSAPDQPADWTYAGGALGLFCSFDLDAGDWDAIDTLARWPGGGDFTAALCAAHPTTGDIFYARLNDGANGRGWKYTRSTDTWAALSEPVWPLNYSSSALDTVRGQLLVVGSFDGDIAPRVLDWDTGGAITASFGGLGESALTLSAYTGQVYDEENDCFLVFYNNSDTSTIDCLRVDAETLDVDAPTISGTIAARPNAVVNSIQYVPELKGVVIANEHSGNVKFMRTA